MDQSSRGAGPVVYGSKHVAAPCRSCAAVRPQTYLTSLARYYEPYRDSMTHGSCRVPTNFGYMNLAGGLGELRLPFDRIGKGDIEPLDLSHMKFCDPAGTVALSAYAATAARKLKRPLPLQGWDSGSYLSRVGFKSLAGYRDDFPRTRLDSDRLTSLIEVATAKERQSARKDVLNVLGVHHVGARMVLDYCLEEMLRNVEDHADSPVNALLQAQYYDNRKQVVMAIADTGYGILHSLRQRHQSIADDEEALKNALKAGVSGRNTRKGTNAGLGLTVSSSLVTKMGGTFQLVTGDTMLEMTKTTQTMRKLGQTRWPGVIVVMLVPRNDSLDWEGTFEEVMGAI